MIKKIYTIGHSTRTIEYFISLLKAHQIGLVVDIRTIPASRYNPQFGKSAITLSLKKAGIKYVWQGKLLGGFRHSQKNSKNTAWRNSSFRGFADYMGTPDFKTGLNFLEKKAASQNTAIMCAEAVPWRCHRSLIADALTKKGWKVYHISSRKTAKKHKLTPFLRVKGGKLIYANSKSNK